LAPDQQGIGIDRGQDLRSAQAKFFQKMIEAEFHGDEVAAIRAAKYL
jgi:hypothetical protein